MAAAAMGEGEATRQKRKKKKKKSKSNHVEFGVASKPLPSAPTHSPAPGTPILEEAAARRKKKKMRKAEQKLPLAQNPQPSAQSHLQLTVSSEMILQGEAMLKHRLGSTQEATSVPGHEMKPVRHETPQAEEQGEGAVLATKKTHKERKSSTSLSTAEIPILEQEAKVTKKRKHRKQQDPSGNLPLPLDPGQAKPQATNAPRASKSLPAAPFLEAPARSPAPMLEEVEVKVVMGKRKMRTEQKVAALPLAQIPTSEEQAEECVLVATMKKKRHKERNKTSLSLFAAAAAAAEIPILEQEAKVTKKRKTSKDQEPSGYSPLTLDLGQTQPQGTNAPHASKPLPAAPFLEAPARSPAPMLEEVEAEVAMGKRKMRIEQKVVALPLAKKPTSEEQAGERVLATMTKKKTRKERNKTSLYLFDAAAAEIPILEQEAKVTKKRKTSKEQEPSGYLPLTLDLGQTQPQGTNAPHASKPIPAAPFLSPAPMLEEVEAEVAMEKRKMRTEQKVAALPLAQKPSSEEQAEERILATTTTKKKHKERNKTSLSLFDAAAAEIPILEQEAKVTKKRKTSKEQEPSGYSPLPLNLRQTQLQGINGPHASKPLPAAPFLEAATEVVMRKREMRKEQKVATLSLAQNSTLEEQREDAMMAKMKKKQKERKSSPSTSVAAETTIWEQEPKVNKKQKQRKQQEPSGKSPLPLDLGQTHSQGGKAPLKQEREADGRKGSSTKKSNGKMPRVRVLGKRELIKEASKKQPVLPEGFVAFSDFVPSCTEQNPDHPPPYIAFFDQFRYKPVRGDHKPPPPRNPDLLSRLTTKGTDKASNFNTSVASKTKQQDLGLGSQEKLNAQVKENPQKKNQRKSSGNSLPIDPTQTCCVQLQGNPEHDQEADAPKVDNIKKSNVKKPRVRAPSKCELFKEQMLPELSELSANGSSKATNSVARKSKKKDSDPGSASGSQEKLHANEKKNPEKKQRKTPPLLTRAEKCSDKYRRVPLDQLIPPPRSPHNLLQEKYASDPWKVIVICMLLNLTQGVQVKKIIEGFFECYPDAQSACNADPDKMAGYLAPLGLQHVKTNRIQRFSKEYVEKEWTYITELCGVGKYAADAYAIFCAGRATEVVPKDHKLVDYWKYVCFELPMMQGSQNVQEAGVTKQELAVIC